MIKIDFKKSYESVDLTFLEGILGALGFPKKFIMWVMSCVRSVSCAILLNGRSTMRFNAAKGVRQGDPLSPYLFSLSMEYLSRLFLCIDDKGFKYHPSCKKNKITHLLFADDLLLFSFGDVPSMHALVESFYKFSKASELVANLDK